MSVFDNYQCEGQLSLFDQDTWFGKMSLEHSQATTEKILEPSLKKQPKLKTRMPMFLDLTGSGQTQELYWVTDIALLGEFMTHSIGEFHKEEDAYVYSLTSMETPHQRYFLNCGEKPLTPKPSKLSWILEENPDPKYRLSARACAGILKRAESRGKELPPLLKETLMHQSVSKNEQDAQGGAKESSYSMNGLERCQHPQTNSSCNILNPHDSQGNQIADEDGVYPTLRGCGGAGYQQGYCLANRKSTYQDTTGALCASGYDKLGTQEAMNDMYVVSSSWDGTQVSPTLTAHNANGGQRMPDKDNFNAVISYGSDLYNGKLTGDQATTLTTNANATGANQTVITCDKEEPILLESNQNHATVQTDGVSTALPASMGMGGGYVPMVTYGLDRASFNQGKNAKYDFAVEEEKAQPIVARGPGGVLQS